MLHDIARRYGVDLAGVPMVGDTLRDLQAAQAAGCEPHLVLSGRAGGLDDETLRRFVEAVPRTVVHDSLQAFADHLMRRDHLADSHAGELL
jgi:D-glycero-D-manno-heptose 1,7-bisphosphate phosphatase